MYNINTCLAVKIFESDGLHVRDCSNEVGISEKLSVSAVAALFSSLSERMIFDFFLETLSDFDLGRPNLNL